MQQTYNFNCAVGREWLTRILQQNKDVTVEFIKVGGEKRTMHCTLHDDVVVPHERKTDHVLKAFNDEVLSVWDIEKNAWRSFRLDSITSVCFDME